MMSRQVSAAAIALYRLAGEPTCIGYTTTSAHLRVLDVHCRLARINSRFIESPLTREAREAFASLLSGQLSLLFTRHPYSAGPVISTAVMLARPTCSGAVAAFLGRLQSPSGEIIVIDLADVIRQHGTPESWRAEIIEGAIGDVVSLPVIDRLGTMSGPQIQAWAEGDYGRLELGRIAHGFKPGWVDISRRAWLDRQVKRKDGPVRPEEQARLGRRRQNAR